MALGRKLTEAEQQCKDWLDKLGLDNSRCVEEFIKELPPDIRDSIQTIIEIINQYLDIEQLLLGYIDQYYLVLLSIINEQIQEIQDQLGWTEAYATAKAYWTRFQSCPGISLLASIIEEQIRLLAEELQEKYVRKNKSLSYLQQVGIRNSDLLVKKMLIGDPGVVATTQSYLNGFAQCLEKGIPSINPPYTGNI